MVNENKLQHTNDESQDWSSVGVDIANRILNATHTAHHNAELVKKIVQESKQKQDLNQDTPAKTDKVTKPKQIRPKAPKHSGYVTPIKSNRTISENLGLVNQSSFGKSVDNLVHILYYFAENRKSKRFFTIAERILNVTANIH
ncbi:MAG: hypothetical protein FWC98_04715 [Bacteroidales bacterium]|nr:hypothetical protein [Bacteroidales bacterium]